jgi:protein-S-isoprenylcysteine O-methyltransferase Ste14
MSNAATPRLLKERMRYTTYFVLALIPIVLFQVGMLPPNSFLHELMEELAYPLVFLAILGRAYCTLFIGGRKNDEVVRLGPYSIVRNPLYVFSFFGVVGVGLQSASPLFLAILVGGFLLYYPKVVIHEEAFLEHKLGEAYRLYKVEVPRWIPNFSLWKSADIIEANPKLVLKTMMDASVFLFPMLLFEAIEMLHEGGLL